MTEKFNPNVEITVRQVVASDFTLGLTNNVTPSHLICLCILTMLPPQILL